MTPRAVPLFLGGLTPGTLLQTGIIGLLAVGALLRLPQMSQMAAALAVVWVVSQWPRLIPLARLFVGLAAVGFLTSLLVWPDVAPRMVTSLVQGTGFAGLMMVLGLVRQPVKRAAVTREAAEYLLSFPPRHLFAGMLAGTQFMALTFNIGIIAIIGDLTQHSDRRRAMVMAAMRGTAIMTIWSPMSLGFAIVTAGVPNIDPMALVAVAFGFTVTLLVVSGLHPLLPAAVRLPEVKDHDGPRGTPLALFAVLGASALLLVLTISMHVVLGLSFTLSTVVVLPVFALTWIALEPARGVDLTTRLQSALTALGDLRSEAALFLSANVIGAVLSVAIQASPLWPILSGAGFATLPTLLVCLFLIPLAAALYLPNTIMVVLAAQLLGPTFLGQAHPLALGLTLCIGWSMAICVNPISAMNLIAGRFCEVPGARVAHLWNLRFTVMTFLLGAGLISIIYQVEGG